MGRKDYNKDLVVVTEIKKIFSKIAAVAVKDEEAITFLRFSFRELIKDLFDLC
jgi:hypothetical protein